jgi:hypothetical protein
MLRSQVYATMNIWLTSLGACADMETVAGDLLVHLKATSRYAAGDKTQQDATSHYCPFIQSIFQLQAKSVSSLQSIQSQYTSKRKRKHGASANASGDNQMTTLSKVDPAANTAVCEAALKSLSVLMDTHGALLEAAELKGIHASVISHLLFIQNRDLPLPYTDCSCRQALYTLLMACVQCVHHQWAPPIHCALPLFRNGLQDTDELVCPV